MSGTTQQDITNLPAMVTLPIGRWQLVMDWLGTHPWREVNPLIVEIHRQVQDAANAQAGDQPPVPNGHAPHGPAFAPPP